MGLISGLWGSDHWHNFTWMFLKPFLGDSCTLSSCKYHHLGSVQWYRMLWKPGVTYNDEASVWQFQCHYTSCPELCICTGMNEEPLVYHGDISDIRLVKPGSLADKCTINALCSLPWTREVSCLVISLNTSFPNVHLPEASTHIASVLKCLVFSSFHCTSLRLLPLRLYDLGSAQTRPPGTHNHAFFKVS